MAILQGLTIVSNPLWHIIGVSSTHVVTGLKGVPASLTFGGVDRNRFIENDISLALSPDDLPMVTMKSIKVVTDLTPNNLNSTAEFKTSKGSDLYTIDSSTPFFWFPGTLCDAIATRLGLEYNGTLELYTYGSNFSGYEAAKKSNFSFTFTVSDLPDSENVIDITLPFSAFDHELSYPFPGIGGTASSQGVRYFPLRKTSDPRQFTFGRVFLQEAYLAVDYERRKFSISRAKFPSDGGADKDIIDIPSGNLSGDSPDPKKGMSKGIAAGIGVGVAIFVLVIACIAITICLRRKKGELPSSPLQEKGQQPRWMADYWRFWRASKCSEPKDIVSEAPDSSVTRYELPGFTQPVELEASEVINPLYGANGKRREGANPPAYYDESHDTTEAGSGSDRDPNSRSGPPIYVLSHIPLDSDDNAPSVVSPLGPSSIFNGTVTGNPSPLTPSQHSFTGSFLQPGSQSGSQPEDSYSSQANSLGPDGPSHAVRSDTSLQQPPHVVRRKFSWEE